MNTSLFRYKLQRLYWDANSFFWDDYLYKTGMKEEFMLLAEYLTERIVKSDAKVLDIGTATGVLAMALAKRGFNVVGIDYSRRMLRKAKKKICKENISNLAFVNADANIVLPFSENKFDLIICRHVFTSIADKNRFIKNIMRVEANYGFVFIAGKHLNAGKKKKFKKSFFHSLVRLIKPLIFSNRNENVDREEIIRLFERCSFKLIDKKSSENSYSLLFVNNK